MKVMLIGATGIIGRAIATALSPRHEVIAISRHTEPLRVDISSAESVRALFLAVGKIDAVISAAGAARFKPLAQLEDEDFVFSLQNKLMGQVNLVLIGREFIADGGSFTLTSGILSHDPVRFGSSASMVNGAIDGFVRAAAIELPRCIRINAVSPGVLVESLPAYGPFFLGHEAVPGARVALAYAKSVEGAQTGQIIRIHG